MKKLLLPLALVAFVSTASSAQSSTHPRKHRHFFQRHKHKAHAMRKTKKEGVYRDADIVNFEPA